MIIRINSTILIKNEVRKNEAERMKFFINPFTPARNLPKYQRYVLLFYGPYGH